LSQPSTSNRARSPWMEISTTVVYPRDVLSTMKLRLAFVVR
jgi:hypothetical protein